MPAVKDIPTANSFVLPVWEVITPYTKHSICMKAMVVAQEEVLKTSAVSQSKMVNLINQLVFECIDEKRAPFDTLENFEKNISVTDRDALIYGLIVASYGENQDFTTSCPMCGKQYEIKNADITDPSNVELNLYRGQEDLLHKVETIELPVSGCRCDLRLPTIYDERVFVNSRGVSADVLNKADDYLIVSKLGIPSTTAEGESKILEITDIFEIYSYMRKLPARDRKYIYTKWKEAFGTYGVTIKIPTICPQCANRTEVYLNMFGELFRLSR